MRRLPVSRVNEIRSKKTKGGTELPLFQSTVATKSSKRDGNAADSTVIASLLKCSISYLTPSRRYAARTGTPECHGAASLPSLRPGERMRLSSHRGENFQVTFYHKEPSIQTPNPWPSQATSRQ